MHLQGDEHCSDCGTKLSEETARARVLDMGILETPWEAAARFGEMSDIEQMDRAGIVELVCVVCYARAPGLEADDGGAMRGGPDA